METSNGTQTDQEMHNTRWKLLTGLQSKLIIPYVTLTILIAFVGTYIITRLVTNSVQERFVNQLYEASRTAADILHRQENNHIAELRLIAYTEGVPQAVYDGDITTLENIILPLIASESVETLAVIDLQGKGLLTLGLDPSEKQYIKTYGDDFSYLNEVQKVIQGITDSGGDKYSGLIDSNLGSELFTIAPVYLPSGERAGALLIATHLSTLAMDAKGQSLADVVILNSENHLLATTFLTADETLEQLEADLASLLDPANASPTQQIKLNERNYEIVFAPFEVRSQSIGTIGVSLPSQYVTGPFSTSRNLFSTLFALGTAVIIAMGFLLYRSIAMPILKLRSMSQAVASGNLEQSTGIQRTDEIGELAEAFDQMTLQLRERTEEAARLFAETVQRNKELAQINAQLQSMQLQLIQTEKLAAVGQLTAGIVHDVKNPLAVIKGLSELILEEDGLDQEIRKEIGIIRESAEKANRIVTDLLKFARQSSPDKQYQDMRETIEACLRLTGYLTKKGHVMVSTDLPDKPVMTCYDTQQIEQVFINMIHNAVQATPDGGNLYINLSQVDEAIAVAFQDTGTGIAPENLKRIFDPFFTTKPEGQGTGLGLSVSYGIIANHNGQINVESELGKGTTFTVLLPVIVPEPAAGELVNG